MSDDRRVELVELDEDGNPVPSIDELLDMLRRWPEAMRPEDV